MAIASDPVAPFIVKQGQPVTFSFLNAAIALGWVLVHFSHLASLARTSMNPLFPLNGDLVGELRPSPSETKPSEVYTSQARILCGFCAEVCFASLEDLTVVYPTFQ